MTAPVALIVSGFRIETDSLNVHAGIVIVEPEEAASTRPWNDPQAAATGSAGAGDAEADDGQDGRGQEEQGAFGGCRPRRCWWRAWTNERQRGCHRASSTVTGHAQGEGLWVPGERERGGGRSNLTPPVHTMPPYGSTRLRWLVVVSAATRRDGVTPSGARSPGGPGQSVTARSQSRRRLGKGLGGDGRGRHRHDCGSVPQPADVGSDGGVVGASGAAAGAGAAGAGAAGAAAAGAAAGAAIACAAAICAFCAASTAARCSGVSSDISCSMNVFRTPG